MNGPYGDWTRDETGALVRVSLVDKSPQSEANGAEDQSRASGEDRTLNAQAHKGGNMTVKVKLSDSVGEILQLDHKEIVRGMGLDWEQVSSLPRGFLVEASPDQLRRLAGYLRDRYEGGGWDQPASYVRSARAGVDKIEKALAKALASTHEQEDEPLCPGCRLAESDCTCNQPPKD